MAVYVQDKMSLDHTDQERCLFAYSIQNIKGSSFYSKQLTVTSVNNTMF